MTAYQCTNEGCGYTFTTEEAVSFCDECGSPVMPAEPFIATVEDNDGDGVDFETKLQLLEYFSFLCQ